MDIDLQNVKKIEIEMQFLILGFFRGFNEDRNLYIDDLIMYIVLAYYQSVEYFRTFNPRYISTNVDKMKITMKDNAATAYGNMLISYGSNKIHTWRFKICYRHLFGAVAIGIDEGECKNCDNEFCHQLNTINYAYTSDGYTFNSGHAGGMGRDSHSISKYGADDIIEMELNGMDHTLSFKINNGKQNIFHVIKPSRIGYRMAVYLHYENDSILLLSYNCRDIE